MKNYLMRRDRLGMREIELSDAAFVVGVRNTEDSRMGFYSNDVVTPDTHRAFLYHRKPHDLVFVFDTLEDERPMALYSLDVDVVAHTGETGRFLVAEPGKGYGLEVLYMMLRYAYDVLRLKSLWCEVLAANSAAVGANKAVGFVEVGINVRGHTNAKGDVMYLTYDGATWPAFRASIEARLEKYK